MRIDTDGVTVDRAERPLTMRLHLDGIPVERADALPQLPLSRTELPAEDIIPAAGAPASPLLMRRNHYAFGGR
ncbi:hypothetical protein ACWDR3_09340 [Streptomyces sp. NPDC001002]